MSSHSKPDANVDANATDRSASGARSPNFAVIFKSHRWDPFVARQLARYRDQCRSAPVFLVLDETGRDFGAVSDPLLIRTTNADLIGMGLADRAERGSLLWWNTDYQNYFVLDRHPGFDYYLCVEYDTRIIGSIDAFVAAAQAAAADMVSLPTRQPKAEWMWTRYHARTYGYDAVRGSLNCISLYSSRALKHLKERRIAMTEEDRRGQIPFWPGNEVFAATEIAKVGYNFISLAAFGDTDDYEWFPPLLEEDVDETGRHGFLHPVLEKASYIQSLLRFENSLPAYFDKRSALRRKLARFPAEDYAPLLAKAAFARARMRVRERFEAVQCRIDALRDRFARAQLPERQAPS